MSESVDLSGARLGRYRIVSRLGSGGMGVVYEALDSTLGRRVAVKVLPTSLAADPMRLQRFEKEAKTASALNHPHVVSIYEIGREQIEDAVVHFIAMEKVDGVTLRAMIGRGALSWRKVCELMAQVAEAMAAAHAAGIVHRDLKPENIMISSGGWAKVLDFGLAKLRAEARAVGGDEDGLAGLSTETGILVGTAGYVSPEQAAGREADHRSDIFALGCILYEAVTGRRAFRGASLVDVLHEIVHAEPEPVHELAPEAPVELQRIVRRCLAKEPDERYQSAKDLALDLREAARAMESGRTAPAVASPPRRSSRVVVIAAAAILVLVAALLGRFLGMDDARKDPDFEPRIQRITASGNVISAAISPDGNFVSYVVSDERGQSLWLRQLASGQELELIAPAPVGYWGHAFTRDGNDIVYALKSDVDGAAGAMYRIAAIGGRPERLVSGADSVPGFSPDGARMSWVRTDYPQAGQSALMIAHSDGTDARPLAVREHPELFTPIFFTGPSWSPDGKLIAVTVARQENPLLFRLLAFDPETGRERVLSADPWSWLAKVEWLPDMTGLVAVGASREPGGELRFRDTSPAQLWLLPYPEGQRRAITSGLFEYRCVTLSADGTKLVAVAVDNAAQLWRAPLDRSSPPVKISRGRVDGWRGVTHPTADRIVFTSVETGSIDLALSAADGTGAVRLTRDSYDNRFPTVHPAGVAYVATTPAGSEVRLVGLDGGAPRTLVRGVDEAPIAISPDGSWLVYSVKRRLWKVALAGGTPVQLTDEGATSPSWSAAGDRVACVVFTREAASRLAVIDPNDGAVLWSREHPFRFATTVRWLRDDRGLLVNNMGKDTSNLWIVPFEGEPERLTTFSDLRLVYFDISPDGKQVVFSRTLLKRDAVVVTDFR